MAQQGRKKVCSGTLQNPCPAFGDRSVTREITSAALTPSPGTYPQYGGPPSPGAYPLLGASPGGIPSSPQRGRKKVCSGTLQNPCPAFFERSATQGITSGGLTSSPDTFPQYGGPPSPGGLPAIPGIGSPGGVSSPQQRPKRVCKGTPENPCPGRGGVCITKEVTPDAFAPSLSPFAQYGGPPIPETPLCSPKCPAFGEPCALSCLAPLMSCTKLTQQSVKAARLESRNQFVNALSVVVSTVMVMAYNDFPTPDEHKNWTKNFLDLVRDGQGQLPPNIQGILWELENRDFENQRRALENNPQEEISEISALGDDTWQSGDLSPEAEVEEEAYAGEEAETEAEVDAEAEPVEVPDADPEPEAEAEPAPEPDPESEAETNATAEEQ